MTSRPVIRRAIPRIAVALCVLAALAPAAPAAALPTSAGLVLTMEAPTTYSAGVALPIHGYLWVAFGLPILVEVSHGISDERIDLLVDGVVVRSVMTASDGAWHVEDLSFDGLPPTSRTLRAVAFRGEVLETSSRPVTTWIDRSVIGLDVTPTGASLAPGEGIDLNAVATYSDGREQPATSQATWTSSDPAVATVSNADGSKGRVTAVAAGSAIISATLDGQSDAATVTVS